MCDCRLECPHCQSCYDKLGIERMIRTHPERGSYRFLLCDECYSKMEKQIAKLTRNPPQSRRLAE